MVATRPSEKDVREHFCKKVGRQCVDMQLKLKKFGLQHKFDCVSVSRSDGPFDEKLIAEINSATLAPDLGDKDRRRKDLNGFCNTKMVRIIEDLFYLSFFSAKEKYLILKDQNIYDEIKRRFEVFAKKKRIKIIHVPMGLRKKYAS